MEGSGGENKIGRKREGDRGFFVSSDISSIFMYYAAVSNNSVVKSTSVSNSLFI